MKNLKQIIISLILGLIVIGLANLVYSAWINSRLTTAYIVLKTYNKGVILTAADVLKVQLNVNKTNITNTVEYATLEQITTMYLTEEIEAGCLIKSSNLSSNQGLLEEEDYEYIAIPFKEAEDALAYHNISKGSRVNLSVSARNEDVDNLLTFLKDKNKVYNNSNNDTFVTVNLYNNIEVIETLDSNGQTVTYGKISQMIFKVPKAEVLLITNLRLYREIFYKSN